MAEGENIDQQWYCLIWDVISDDGIQYFVFKAPPVLRLYIEEEEARDNWYPAPTQSISRRKSVKSFLIGVYVLVVMLQWWSVNSFDKKINDGRCISIMFSLLNTNPDHDRVWWHRAGKWCSIPTMNTSTSQRNLSS